MYAKAVLVRKRRRTFGTHKSKDPSGKELPTKSGEGERVAKNGFFIENGKIGRAISETMISGNLASMLNDLVAISKETLVDGTVVAPYMAFDGITVSGK